MYNIKRDGVEIASDVEEKTYTDTGLDSDTDYTYTVEISGVEGSEATVPTKTTEPPSPPNRFVSNKELTWADLPAYNQPNNGSLKLLSQTLRDNVPFVVETGSMVEQHTFDEQGDSVVELVPEFEVQFETRTVYTYEADFEWDNCGCPDNWMKWLVDVEVFKNNRLKSGRYAFYLMPAASLTALPDLDTSNLTDMSLMFSKAFYWNQPLTNLDTSNVTSMNNMFYESRVFNQPISHFDTSNVEKMGQMFWAAYAFNQNISNWCVQQIPDKPRDFDLVSGFENQTHLQPKWGQPC